MPPRKRTADSQGPAGDTKKAKVNSGSDATSNTDSNGDQYWEISKMRRVTVSEFRGKTMVSVREYYEKDGQELPGKKGISMTLDQFSAFIKLLPDIEQAVKKQGESLPRPAYTGSVEQVDAEDDQETNNASPSKQNIEATSDEDSDS
ncbi:hypothetical protein PoHVEF18_010693 [Penicillium ochrochloron]